MPSLPLGHDPQKTAIALSATGTDHLTPSPLVPVLVPTPGKAVTLQSILDKIESAAEKLSDANAIDVTACPVKQNNPLTSAVNGLRDVGGRRLELPTPSLSSNRTHDATDTIKGFTPTPFPVCTRVCTSEPENANADTLEAASLGTPPQAADADQGDTLDKLAAALLTLLPADRERLAAMLTRHQGESEGELCERAGGSFQGRLPESCSTRAIGG
jgi:hypothetical protein